MGHFVRVPMARPGVLPPRSGSRSIRRPARRHAVVPTIFGSPGTSRPGRRGNPGLSGGERRDDGPGGATGTL